MRRRKYYRTNKRGRKRGRGVPYIYNNRIYLGKKHKKEQEQFLEFSRIFCKTSDILLDCNDQKEIRLVYQCKETKEKQENILKINIRQKEVEVLVTHLSCYIL